METSADVLECGMMGGGKGGAMSYTEDERDRLGALMDKLPSEYYGLWVNGEWEDIILEMAEIIREKRERGRLQIQTMIEESKCPITVRIEYPYFFIADEPTSSSTAHEENDGI